MDFQLIRARMHITPAQIQTPPNPPLHPPRTSGILTTDGAHGNSTDPNYLARSFVTVTDYDGQPTGITLTVDADTGTGNVQTALAEGGGAKTVRITAMLDGSITYGTGIRMLEMRELQFQNEIHVLMNRIMGSTTRGIPDL